MADGQSISLLTMIIVALLAACVIFSYQALRCAAAPDAKARQEYIQDLEAKLEQYRIAMNEHGPRLEELETQIASLLQAVTNARTTCSRAMTSVRELQKRSELTDMQIQKIAQKVGV